MTIKGATTAPQFADQICLLNDVERLKSELAQMRALLVSEHEARIKAENLLAIYEDMWVESVCRRVAHERI